MSYTMKIYLVGGAVRDRLLGRPAGEHDYVVVGSSVAEILKLGFKKVGRDFPVFLHPKTHEEYALARTERKVARGYHGFVCHAESTITLEEDLGRRDLTINAMAEDMTSGELIDPYRGTHDLRKKILRHVSPAFAEDPVRILRVARFAARLGDFKVAQSTNRLMARMVKNGEVDALVPERVWQELVRALGEGHPYQFFATLANCGALEKLFPSIFKHLTSIKKTLETMTPSDTDPAIRLAAIAANLDRAEMNSLGKRYRLPRSYHDLALLVIKLKIELKNGMLTFPSNHDAIITLLEQLDAYRRPQRFKQALRAYQIYTKALKTSPQRLSNNLLLAHEFTKEVHLAKSFLVKYSGVQLKELLHKKRVRILEALPLLRRARSKKLGRVIN
jgi:tRNA nucleotidyltransferase (CCA-adding enzyme)